MDGKKAPNPISILLVGQTASCQEIRHALEVNHLDHEVAEASSCAEARACLAEKRVTVILCEKDLTDGTWHSVLEHARGMASSPAIVVCSRHADDRLWAEALNLGVYDVLRSEPLVHEELIHAIESAHRSCPEAKTESA